MKCDKCSEFNATSIIKYSDQGWVTTAYRRPFTDEQGYKHDHSIRIITYSHQCSEGHWFKTKEYIACWCGWTAKQCN